MRLLRSILALLFATLAVSTAFGQITISVSFAPPELPVYEQPLCPYEGYIWTPGYWAYGPYGYFWVPGTWVEAPEVGYLWTPGYWGWEDDAYVWHPGYWAPEVGFYGGINYGYGYFGEGYQGGYWRDRQFYYNRSVNNVNVTNIRNIYNTTVVNNNSSVTRVSYNGGHGGIQARPTVQQQAVVRQAHVGPTATQLQHQQAASSNRELAVVQNHGKPPIAATQKPADFQSAVVPATRGANYTPPAIANQPRGANPATRPENNSTPANNPANNNVPRPQPERPGDTSQPRPQSQPRPEPQPRQAEPQPHQPVPQPEPRRQPEPPPRPEPQPRPESRPPEPQPRPEPRQQEQPRPEAQPRPQPQTRQPEPRPENRPPDNRPPENRDRTQPET